MDPETKRNRQDRRLSQKPNEENTANQMALHHKE